MKNEYLKKIGFNIKKVRKQKGLSQERLAELVGKSRNYIGMIERGESNIALCFFIISVCIFKYSIYYQTSIVKNFYIMRYK